MNETVYINQKHAKITIWVHIIRVCIKQHDSVLCSERQRDTAPTCDSQCQTACRDIPICWHLVIGHIKSFKILIILATYVRLIHCINSLCYLSHLYLFWWVSNKPVLTKAQHPPSLHAVHPCAKVTCTSVLLRLVDGSHC